ncbi:MAG: ABC transporter permease [Planctomycetota bacterium]|nr:ABC transporter permease [Planctomycetota bacterium]
MLCIRAAWVSEMATRGVNLWRFKPAYSLLAPMPSPNSPLQSTFPFSQIAWLGHHTLQRIAAFGRFSRFAGAVFAGLMHPGTWARRDRIMRQFSFVGTMSVPVLALTGAFIGMILAIEGYVQFQSIGQEGRLGGVINLSLARQLGPALAAVMLAGRVGCALSAELGSMRVTEQLDAMRAMAADPIRVLVVPRFVACVVMIPPLTIISNLCGVVGGWLVTTRYFGADDSDYWRFTEIFVGWFDLANGLIKSVFFGAAIGLIACYKGFNCKPGAEGVGQATTDSFVSGFLAIIALNLILAKLLNDFDVIVIKGGQATSIFQ